MSRKDLLARLKEHWGIVALVAGLIGSLTGSKMVWGGDRMNVVEEKVAHIERQMGTVDAIALSVCIKEDNPIARQRLECGRREREAGVR